MIIDFHTHIFPDGVAEKALTSLLEGSGGVYTNCHDLTLSGLIRTMDEDGVDISVNQPVVTNPRHTKHTNDFAASIQSDRIISFGGAHPKSENYKEDVDYVVSLGLKGVKMHPEYQDFDLADESYYKVFDYILSKGLILLFHAGYDPAYKQPFKTKPSDFVKLSRAMGGGVIVAAHLGGCRQYEEVVGDLCGSDVYIDTSMGFSEYGTETFMRVFKTHGADRILFATDSPWSRAKNEIEAVRSLAISDEDKEKILSGNAKRLLKLK